MSFLSADDVLEDLTPLIGSLDALFDEDPKLAAINHALKELHWEFPLTDDRKCYWLIERSKRQVYFILLSEAAHKFRYKDIHLQHRFANYIRLVKLMDDAFATALEDEIDIFDTNVYPSLVSYVTNGFQYDDLGRWM